MPKPEFFHKYSFNNGNMYLFGIHNKIGSIQVKFYTNEQKLYIDHVIKAHDKSDNQYICWLNNFIREKIQQINSEENKSVVNYSTPIVIKYINNNKFIDCGYELYYIPGFIKNYTMDHDGNIKFQLLDLLKFFKTCIERNDKRKKIKIKKI